MGKYLLLSIVLVVVLMGLFLALQNFRTAEFLKTMSVGDVCLFKNGENWQKARITAIFLYTIIVEDEDGDAHFINRTEVKPPSRW